MSLCSWGISKELPNPPEAFSVSWITEDILLPEAGLVVQAHCFNNHSPCPPHCSTQRCCILLSPCGSCLAQARYELAYSHVMSVLKYLLDPSSASGGSLPDESRLSAADRQLFLKTVLSARAPPPMTPPAMQRAHLLGFLARAPHAMLTHQWEKCWCSEDFCMPPSALLGRVGPSDNIKACPPAWLCEETTSKNRGRLRVLQVTCHWPGACALLAAAGHMHWERGIPAAWFVVAWQHANSGDCGAAPQRAAAAEDPYFQECLFGTLLEARAVSHLLGMDSPLLERYLRTTGGLAAERGVPFQPGSPIGPLSPTQVLLLCARALCGVLGMVI